MTSPLIKRLTDDLGWSELSNEEQVAAYLARPGMHALFVPGNPDKNLETNDAAVIIPELVAAFRNVFDCAVVADPIERSVRERFNVFPTPSLIFYSDGDFRGAIPRVRDWDDYIVRVGKIIKGELAGAA